MNARRQRFVNAYLGEAAGNATKAAILAGYSEKAARQVASRLLTYADVKAAIHGSQQAAAEDAGVTAAGITKELQAVAFAPVTDVQTTHKLKALELLGKHAGMFKEGHSEARVVVNLIGFPVQPTAIDVTPREQKVVASTPRAALISAPGDLCRRDSGSE